VALTWPVSRRQNTWRRGEPLHTPRCGGVHAPCHAAVRPDEQHQKNQRQSGMRDACNGQQGGVAVVVRGRQIRRPELVAGHRTRTDRRARRGNSFDLSCSCWGFNFNSTALLNVASCRHILLQKSCELGTQCSFLLLRFFFLLGLHCKEEGCPCADA